MVPENLLFNSPHLNSFIIGKIKTAALNKGMSLVYLPTEASDWLYTCFSVMHGGNHTFYNPAAAHAPRFVYSLLIPLATGAYYVRLFTYF